MSIELEQADDPRLVQVTLGQAFFPRKRVEGFLVEITETGGLILASKRFHETIRLYIPKPWMMFLNLPGGERPTLAHVQIVDVASNDTGSLLCRLNFSPVTSQRVLIREAIRLVREHTERVSVA